MLPPTVVFCKIYRQARFTFHVNLCSNLSAPVKLPIVAGYNNPRSFWSAGGRAVVFLLAASSIACLLCDFYQLCPMRQFTLFIFLPAMLALAALALFDRQYGDRQLWRAVAIGLVGGLAGAIAYDLFRLPFVFAREWGISAIVPPMPLFKVFPRFGAMILGQPVEQATYSLGTQILGWTYHFSNGATFGVMYLALVGNPSSRSWVWAVLMAVGIELAMLITPYPRTFGIPITALFIAVTLTAHVIFGIGLGLLARILSRSAQIGLVVAPTSA